MPIENKNGTELCFSCAPGPQHTQRRVPNVSLDTLESTPPLHASCPGAPTRTHAASTICASLPAAQGGPHATFFDSGARAAPPSRSLSHVRSTASRALARRRPSTDGYSSMYVTSITWQPAACADMRPDSPSSYARQKRGSASMRRAASRKMSGAGLPLGTSAAQTMLASFALKRSSRPAAATCASTWWRRPLVAMHTGMPAACASRASFTTQSIGAGWPRRDSWRSCAACLAARKVATNSSDASPDRCLRCRSRTMSGSGQPA
mmetsp:Transcript_63977/g.175703  ORF Transcript_63977/g.175703 Transcript_63977/m.175703 type:complete len:264 (-) Transcript_63977:383-1174(-)